MREYKIICSRHAHELSDRSTELLNNGWQLHGSPILPSFTDEDRLMSFAYVQAFVKNTIDQSVNSM